MGYNSSSVERVGILENEGTQSENNKRHENNRYPVNRRNHSYNSYRSIHVDLMT